MIYLCSPVKTRVVLNPTCLYGSAENVQNKGTILQARRSMLMRAWVSSV